MKRSKFQFTNPELEKVIFVVNEDFTQEKCDGISMESNTDIKALENNEAYVALTLHVGAVSDEQPFDIIVKMSARFMWEEDLEEKKVKQLLKTNAPAALLSYIRPIVSNLTMSSRYPVLNIPFIDFTQSE